MAVPPADEGTSVQGRRLTAFLLVLLLVPAAGWLLSDGSAGTFGFPPPATPPPGTPLQVEVHIDVALDGPLGRVLSVQVDNRHGHIGRVGDGALPWAELVLLTRTDRTVDLPTAAMTTTSRPTEGWTIDPASGVGVQLHAPTAVEVVAASDPGLVGPIDGPTVVPGVPKGLQLVMAVPELPAEDASWTVAVPLDDSTLHVTVRTTPTDPGPATDWPVAPAPDVAGAELPVPPLGEARPAVLGNGLPVWISNTDAHGVTVVDARAPGPVDATTPLVQWCEPSVRFGLARHGLEFDPGDAVLAGPSTFGLTTYEGRVDGKVYRLRTGVPGDPRPPSALGRPGEGFVPSGAWTGAAALCHPVAPPDDGERSFTTFDAALYPSSSLLLLPTTRRPSTVDGRLLIEGDGSGWLCESGGPDRWTCTGERIPVDLMTSWPRTDSGHEGARWRRAQDGPFVVGSMLDGAITSLWQLDPTDVEPDPTAWFGRPARYLGLDTDDATVENCSGWIPGCAGALLLDELVLRTDDGRVENHPSWDGTLPDRWWLLAPSPDHDVSTQYVDAAGLDGIPDDLSPGDLILLSTGWGLLDVSVAPLRIPG